MLHTPKSRIQHIRAGAQVIGWRNVWMTALYKLRWRWCQARFGPPPRSLLQTVIHLMSTPATAPTGARPTLVAGDVESATIDRPAQRVLLHCTHGVASLEALTDHTVRFRLAKGSALPNYFSYATVLESQPIEVEFSETAEEIVLSTPALRVHVRRRPLGLQFFDGEGQPLAGPIAQLGWDQGGSLLQQQLPAGLQFYGLGERATPLALRGRAFELTTRDPEIYDPGDDPLYINIPFLVGLDQGRAFGVLFDNPSDGFLDLGAADPQALDYRIRGEELRFDFVFGPHPAQVVERYTQLTGRMNLPPRWTLGYQQSRWSYETADIVRDLADEFRRRHIPCDAIHLDIDYMDGFRCFTWDPEAFLDPSGLIAHLHDRQFKAVAMIDPGIKVDPEYEVCAVGVAQEMFCKLPDGSLFHGPVWPGECYFPDFTNPRVRAWWGELYAPLVALGIDGFWNDMNEPTVFGQSTFPDAVQHDLEGRGAAHWQVHSAYGMQMVRATFEGLNRLRPDWRNWVFTRSAYAGVQRYASSWTGDNRSEWEDLRITPAMLLNLGLSGLAFTGPDVGGFAGAPTPELFARWISMGAFTPFYRTHSAKHTPPQEPWSFGPEVEAIARAYIGWRYRLLPYLYTAFWQCSQQGAPIMRPLLFEDPADPDLLALDDEWLLGDHLLVAPVLEAGADRRRLLLPPGQWYDFWSDELLSGPAAITRAAPLEVVPLYVRAGAVLPLGPVRQTSHERPDAPLELHLYAGDGDSWLYEDDGETLAHERGGRRISRFQLRRQPGGMALQRQIEDGYTPPYRQLRVVVHGAAIRAAHLGDQAVPVQDNAVEIPVGGWEELILHV